MTKQTGNVYVKGREVFKARHLRYSIAFLFIHQFARSATVVSELVLGSAEVHDDTEQT